MHKVNISNFKKILNPPPIGTDQDFEYKLEELSEIIKKLKEENERLLKEVSGEEYVKDFNEYIAQSVAGVGSASASWISGDSLTGLTLPSPTFTHIPTALWPISTKPEVAETNIDKLLDELNQKNQMIQMLSTSLKVSDKIFAQLLNRLSIGFVLFFLLTIIICYLAFS